MSPFTAQALTPVAGGASRLWLSTSLSTLSTDAIPSSVKTTKVGLTGDDHAARTKWIHVAPMGEWHGHNAGKFSLTPDHFASVKTVLDGKQTPCSLDYEHASIHPSGGPTPAAGFVQATEVRSDGLWACVEFTREAWDLITGGKYRFCSGVFDFTAVDPVTNEPILCTLDTIALTNRPFIDGQHPIALSRAVPAATRVPLSSGAKKMKIQRKAFDKLLDGLGMKEFSPEQLTKLAEFLSADEDSGPPEPDAAAMAKAAKDAELTAPTVAATSSVAASAETPVAASAEAPVAASAPAADAALADMPMEEPAPAADVDMDVDAKLMEATGLDDAGLVAALMANFDAIVALLTGATTAAASVGLTKDLAVKALSTQLVEAQRKLNVYATAEKAALSKSLDGEVELLIKEGKLHPAGRAEVIALARKSPAEFRALAKILKPSLPVDLHATALTPPVGGSEHVEVPTALPADHPKVVELTRQLDAMKVTGEHRAKALKSLTG